MVSDPSPIFRRKAGQDPIAESITQFGLFLHTAISPLLTEIDWTGCSLETNARKSVRLHSLQSAIENVKTCPELAKRVEWIENVVVPVVLHLGNEMADSHRVVLFVSRFWRR